MPLRSIIVMTLMLMTSFSLWGEDVARQKLNAKLEKLFEKEEYPHIQTLKQLSLITALAEEYYNPEDITVIIDLEAVFEPTKLSFRYPVMLKHRKLLNRILSRMVHSDQEKVANFIYANAKNSLIEPDASRMIQKLQQKGIRVGGLLVTPRAGTAIDAGKARYVELHKHNISFSTFQGIENPVVFREFYEHHGLHQGFYQGLLTAYRVSRKQTKDFTLMGFLSRLKTLPRVVIYVDPQEPDLLSVHRQLYKLIPQTTFIGVHYRKSVQKRAVEKNVPAKKFRDDWHKVIKKVMEIDA